MSRFRIAAVASFVFLVIWGCSHREPAPVLLPVMIPPRIDLRPHELIGVLEFTSTSEGKLGPLATKRFIEWARRDQVLVRIVELGSRKKALRALARDRWDPETFKALGARHGLKTILMGEMKVSDIRPDVQVLAGLGTGQVTARVNAILEVQLVEAATGASLWSASGSGTRSLGHLSVSGGRQFAFDADDPDRAYGTLVDDLVEQTTRDFRVTWDRR